MTAQTTARSEGDYILQVSQNPGTLVFDLEANGLHDATKIHCIGSQMPGWTEPSVIKGDMGGLLLAIQHSPFIVGHNIIGFDIPAIKRILKPDLKIRGKIIDTLILSKLAFPTLFQTDCISAKIPKNLYGRHSLEAWGHRLGEHKGDFKGPWDEWTKEMHDYCGQDVKVTMKLLRFLAKAYLPEMAVTIEMDLQEIVAAMERKGVCFNERKAMVLNARLETIKNENLVELQKTFPPVPAKCLGIYKNQEKRAAKLLADQKWTLDDWANNREWLEECGIKFKWEKEIPFNPNSTQQIAERMMALGWVPTEFTETGLPQVNEPVIKFLNDNFPEAAPLAGYLLADKRLGQISNPKTKNGWLDHLQADGRIHGRFDTMGCISFRFSHSKPNLGQVPRLGSPYGAECREMFEVPEGWSMVGVDAAGLELRMLGHYMAPWDGGAFGRAAATGRKEDGTDVHTLNQKAAQLPNRDTAKTFIYALIYGAGDVKQGQICDPTNKDKDKLGRIGKNKKALFYRNTPAAKRLTDAVRQKAAKTKTLRGLDGRVLHVRSAHSALNLLLQSAGAIVVKLATNIFRRKAEAAGYIMERDWFMVLHVHDEFQVECKNEIANDIAKIAELSFVEAGIQLNLTVPLAGESAIGRNWKETH